MLHLLSGENSFEIEREIARLRADFSGVAESVDGDELTIADLDDLLVGQSLFADKRLIIIRELSRNKPVWDALPEWFDRMSDSIRLVLIESKPDKRTRSYKALQKIATVTTHSLWTDKDKHMAEQWVIAEAHRHGLELTKAHARHLVERAGIDQWRLFHAIEKLSLLDTFTDESINDVIEPHLEENVFMLLETALRGDSDGIVAMIVALRLQTDPYQTFGLLSSQILQLAMVALTSKSTSQIATETKVHPYALSKIAPQAQRLGQSGAQRLVEATAQTDMMMKSSGHDPWLLVEQLLIKIART